MAAPYTIRKHKQDKNVRIATLRPEFLEQLLNSHPTAARLTLSKIRVDGSVVSGVEISFDYDQTAQLEDHFEQWDGKPSNEIPEDMYSMCAHYREGVLGNTLLDPVKLLSEANRFYWMVVAEKNKANPAT